MKTSKIIGLTLVMLMAIVKVQAQNFKYGVQLSSIFSVQSEIGDIYDNSNIRSGIGVSAFGTYALNDRFSLQAEVGFDQKGSKTDEVNNKYDYLSIPVLASYNLDKGKKTPWKLDFYAGTYLSFLTDAKQEFDNAEIKDIDMYDNSNNTEFGLLSGFAYRYPVKNNNLLVNLRFGMGLTAFDKKDSDPKNKFMSLGIGYEF